MDCLASLREIGRCVQQQNGRGLAELLRVLDSPVRPVSAVNEGRVAAFAAQCCGEKWGPIATRQVLARDALASGDWERAYGLLVASYNSLINALRDESGWTAPVVRTFTYEARVVAERADTERSSSSRKLPRRGEPPNASGQRQSRHDTLRDVEKTLKKGFTLCWTDRNSPDNSKKRATLYVVSQLLKIYFKLNLLKLAQPLIRPVELAGGRDLASFLQSSRWPKGDVVAYRFFVGRLRMFEDQYASAEAHLAYAFERCDKRSFANKRCILEFLLPVRLRRGSFPKPELLQKYGLAALAPLVHAVKQGDLRTFNYQLDVNKRTFVERGTFLLLEKVKILVYRNLVKKVFLLKAKAVHMKLLVLQQAFAFLGFDVDGDEVECILANLIYRGLVKGYISHQKQTLVLSKKDPFPLAAATHPPDGA
mmetsp:Transcript_21705/g.66882  ORF Transcript_21705/g.66882 Transcript_21705/m.66882 type:complete len:423 (-) Transcript_21705:42-1310(-)